MPDILKSAQAQIDDAAGQVGASPASPASPPPVLEAQAEETLLPSTASSLASPAGSDTVLKDLNLPYSSHAEPHTTEQKPAETENAPGEPPPIPVVPPAIKKKHGNKFLLLAVLLFLFATLPLAVFFISQQNQLADLRGRAVGPYPTCKSPNVCVPSAIECRDGGGKQVSLTCPSGKIGVCCDFGSATNTPTPTPIRSSTPTPTPTIPAGSCGNAGQACCDPFSQNGTICNGSLYCNTATGTCQTTSPPNLCQGSQGSGGSAGTECEVFRCGSQCNAGNQCTISAGRFPCDQASLNGQCGQIDWKDTSGNYCGVKSQNCGGSCAGTTTTTPPPGGTPPPGETPPPGATPTPPPATPTPTPTPIPGETCEVIKVYSVEDTDITQEIKDGTKKLALGEQIILATSIGSATKARFRIQGVADWTENNPDETTETEYRLTITIPTTLTQAQGTFEAEVYVDGQWK